MPNHPNFILNQSETTISRYLLASLLLAGCVRSKKSPPILLAKLDNLEAILLLRSAADQHQKQKDEIWDSPCVPHSLIKPGSSHLTTSPLSYLSHLATSVPSHLSHLATSSLPTPYHSQFATSLPSNLSKLVVFVSSNLSHPSSLLLFHLSHLHILLPSYFSHLSYSLSFHLS